MPLFSVHMYFKIRWFGFFFSTLTLLRDFETFFPGLSSPHFSLLTELSAYRSYS